MKKVIEFDDMQVIFVKDYSDNIDDYELDIPEELFERYSKAAIEFNKVQMQLHKLILKAKRK
jgi:hypothetical protein